MMLYFQQFFLFISLGSIIFGTLGAIVQVKIKRLIGYASIAHGGYIFFGLACNSLAGNFSSFIYLIVYAIVTLNFFCLLINTEHLFYRYNMMYLNQLYGLFLYNKEISFHFLITFISMASIPPVSTFFVKFFLFTSGIEARLEFSVLIILILSLASTFYYLEFVQSFFYFKINEINLHMFTENNLVYIFLRASTFFLLVGLYFLLILEPKNLIHLFSACYCPCVFY
jgi:NADH-quinone oxidoreductase subunit N